MQTDQDFKPGVIFQAVRLVGLGIPVTKVGRRFQVPHYRVRFWVSRYANLTVEQVKGAVEKHRPGRPRKAGN